MGQSFLPGQPADPSLHAPRMLAPTRSRPLSCRQDQDLLYHYPPARPLIFSSTFMEKAIRLQALGVVWVADFAGASAGTGGASGVSDTTTLSPVGGSAASWGCNGSRSGLGGGDGLGGGWAADGLGGA